ncbi:hypothetical protein MAHJHV34_49850 [Mycobacterium avium subsp. hominissuis]
MAIAVYLRAKLTWAVKRVLAPTDTMSEALGWTWFEPGVAVAPAAWACWPAARTTSVSTRTESATTQPLELALQDLLAGLFSLLVRRDVGPNVAGHTLAVLPQ